MNYQFVQKSMSLNNLEAGTAKTYMVTCNQTVICYGRNVRLIVL